MHVKATANFTASDADHVAEIGCSNAPRRAKDRLLKSFIVATSTVARAERDDDVLQVPILQGPSLVLWQ